MGIFEMTCLKSSVKQFMNSVSSDKLKAGQVLLSKAGERITSQNGDYSLIMQEDGNFVAYKTGGILPFGTRTQQPKV